ATLRSQIGGAMKTGVPFVIKFDNASPSFVAVIINAAAAVYSENPSAYLQAVRAFVVNGKSHSAASVIYAAAAEKEKQNLGRALAARANGAARTA
ncbi:MAG: hypothetical protein LBL21_00110, partial [Rickettsiales bacterium]|nr:hypothetical protein [Rickettsiales bacterium]